MIKRQKIDRDMCYIEQGIIAALIDIESGRFEHYRLADKPRIIAALAEHHRTCATCQGVRLVNQLFGRDVKVVVL